MKYLNWKMSIGIYSHLAPLGLLGRTQLYLASVQSAFHTLELFGILLNYTSYLCSTFALHHSD